jgi:predicted enzyme related to lactoylglutathione lyase
MVVFDCADPEPLAEFWQVLTGVEIDSRETDWCSLRAPRTGGIALGFQRVPEEKQAKNRVHLDFDVDDLPSATERAESLGAIRLGDVVTEDDGESFQVMADPEGNEFCLIQVGS